MWDVTTASPAKTHPYHHGDLRNALVEAAAGLAREGGPGAVVLREAARRVGVSPNAAYRHFDALPALVEAVARLALAEMARAMQAELDQLVPTGDAGADAREYLKAVGRGYVHYALAEPGLFATAFTCVEGTGQDAGLTADPYGLLLRALDQLENAGLLKASEHQAAEATSWAAVHGLSMLLLGPMSAVPVEHRQAVIDGVLDLVARGLTTG